MMPYRTPQQELKQKTLRLRGLAVVAIALGEWDEITGTNGLLSLIEKHSGEDDALFMQASIIFAASSAQRKLGGLSSRR